MATTVLGIKANDKYQDTTSGVGGAVTADFEFTYTNATWKKDDVIQALKKLMDYVVRADKI